MDLPEGTQPENTSIFQAEELMVKLGEGYLGGKAQGLAKIKDILLASLNPNEFPDVTISIPKMVVLSTEIFDQFILHNNLKDVIHAGVDDERLALKFQQAELPLGVLGELRKLVMETHLPLAVRSSSLLEDTSHEPFAGIYATKIIPNNQYDANTRFRRLIEAIKFVYASTYFQSARDYMKITHHAIEDEKMAVIIQKVIGGKHGKRFYPEISGVARSYNFYPMARATHEEGVVHLALGLGKTIVDGGISWDYSPARPKVKPPYRTVDELLKGSQTEFWAVNLGEPPEYNPIKETEYLIQGDLKTAEKDGVLPYLASTYDPYAERLTIGVGNEGPRVLTFGRILVMEEIPLNAIVKRLLSIGETAFGGPVEIEFAMTLNPRHFGFLQIRPMVVSLEEIELDQDELNGERVLLSSDDVLGHGVNDQIRDIVFAHPDQFQPRHTQTVAKDLERINRKLVDESRPYLLIVFGRLGTTDPWLGIPIRWGGVSGAQAIVETTMDDFNMVLSQGSHYFHNLTSLGIHYFTLPHGEDQEIDWKWLLDQKVTNEFSFIRHIRLDTPLTVKVDGRSGKGVVLKPRG